MNVLRAQQNRLTTVRIGRSIPAPASWSVVPSASTTAPHEAGFCMSSEVQMAPKKGSTNWRKGTGQIVTKACPVCGNPFTVPLWRVNEGVGKTCSMACRNIWLSRVKSRSITIECTACGREINREPYAATGERFCSRRCANSRFTGKTGSDNPNWRGGRVTYYGPNWKEQRRLARQRDEHTCQRCTVAEHEYGQELDVHHIRPFREFGYVPGVNETYLQANDLNNLISLCMRCHKEVEPNG